jgi:hypothetical protein
MGNWANKSTISATLPFSATADLRPPQRVFDQPGVGPRRVPIRDRHLHKPGGNRNPRFC